MRMRMLRLCTAAALLSAVAAAQGQTAFVEGDAGAGAAKYQAVCAACHGVAGNSVIPAQPILAGQHAEYLANQTRMYASGERPSAIMAPLAQILSDQEINDIAVYLAGQKAGLSGATDSALAAKGEQLYRLGRPDAGIPSCMGCHGPAGAGLPPLYPRLSGQHAPYAEATMREFAAGNRPGVEMQEIAAALTEEDIAALAEYMAGLY